MTREILELQQKLDAIEVFEHTLDQSSQNTLQLIRQMVQSPAKHELLLEQLASIIELLDTFLGLSAQSGEPQSADSIGFAQKQFVPATATLSPSHSNTELRADKAELQTFKELAEYRAELNRQARELIESEECEIKQLHEVIEFLISGDIQPIIDACKRGESGLDAVKAFFEAKPAAIGEDSLLRLSQSEFGKDTTRIIEDVVSKNKNAAKKTTLAHNCKQREETNYERALRESKLRK